VKRMSIQKKKRFYSDGKCACILDDKNLPNVPPLQLSVPADYPDQSPLWIKNPRQYGMRTLAWYLGACVYSSVGEI